MIGENVVTEDKQETREYTYFLISVSLSVAMCVSAVFLGMTLRSRDLIKIETLTRARACFQNILAAHAWSASHGGVLVESKPESGSVATLPEQQVRTSDGKTYTQKAPAVVVREMAEALEQPGLLSYRLTSLKPYNPQSKPDSFEEAALKAFELGEWEAYRTERGEGGSQFRYMGPLYMENACLQCHANQGYKVGDVRGGVSVTFQTDESEFQARKDFVSILASAILTVVLVMILVIYFFSRLQQRLKSARKLLETMASLDGLTGLYNRRTLDRRFSEEWARHRRTGRNLSCLLCDLDHFKNINDEFGHLAGDEVLKGVASTLAGSVRNYDIVGRYGGDEFFVLLPETSIDWAVTIAARLRSRIAENVFIQREKDGGRPVKVSFGVAVLRETDRQAEEMLHRADEALLRAKAHGRNRVEVST